MDVAKLLHASQEFEWGEPVCSGDTITTELSVKDIYPKGPNGFYVFEPCRTTRTATRSRAAPGPTS